MLSQYEPSISLALSFQKSLTSFISSGRGYLHLYRRGELTLLVLSNIFCNICRGNHKLDFLMICPKSRTVTSRDSSLTPGIVSRTLAMSQAMFSACCRDRPSGLLLLGSVPTPVAAPGPYRGSGAGRYAYIFRLGHIFFEEVNLAWIEHKQKENSIRCWKRPAIAAVIIR